MTIIVSTLLATAPLDISATICWACGSLPISGSPRPRTTRNAAPYTHNIGKANGFTSDGFPVILTAHELNDELEANGCGAEAHEQPDGSNGGAVCLFVRHSRSP